MFYCVIFILLLSGELGWSVNLQNCGRSVSVHEEGRIVGGKKAKHGRYPWVVALYERVAGERIFICGGSILNENWIVTAAHCLDFPDSPDSYRIRAGMHKLSETHKPTVRTYKISELVVHVGYDEDTYENDIALLKTSERIDISASEGYINGICLPTSVEDLKGHATVVGWGHTKEDGSISDTLKVVKVPIVDRKTCNNAYDEDPDDNVEQILRTMICAGTTGKDSCQNDSGGPMFQRDVNGTATIIGIVSHGAGCGAKFYPGIYLNIAMYTDWIDAAIK